MINGKKMAILKRKAKQSTGTLGWPKLSRSKQKPFNEIKVSEDK